MTGLPRSAARRWMSARAYSGSAQPRSPSGYELSNQAQLIVPADDPYTASKPGTRPSSYSARAIPPEMAPRIPPPSMASATRRPSPRSARSSRTWPACARPARARSASARNTSRDSLTARTRALAEPGQHGGQVPFVGNREPVGGPGDRDIEVVTADR
jgi:hypothetical protein